MRLGKRGLNKRALGEGGGGGQGMVLTGNEVTSEIKQ